MAGLIVAAVREIVRDLIADLVSRLIVYTAELAATLGLAAPAVVAQATSFIARGAAKIADILSKLVRTITGQRHFRSTSPLVTPSSPIPVARQSFV